MQLTIMTSHYEERVEILWIELRNTYGTFVVQEGHVPMIFSLVSKSEFSFALHDGKQEVRLISEGIAHITRHAVTIIMAC